MQGAEDHIMPRKEGGKNTLENGMTLCRSCHKKIHATLQFPIP